LKIKEEQESQIEEEGPSLDDYEQAIVVADIATFPAKEDETEKLDPLEKQKLKEKMQYRQKKFENEEKLKLLTE
jgi:hypothetical protein|tara:strand:+ start:376 stop:597 length:222 start_codon:yes stop_codon:yes gene_type:complete